MASRIAGMRNFPIWIIIAVLVVGGVVGGILIGVSSGGKVGISQPVTPVAPAVSTPTETTPNQTSTTATEPGVVVLTVEELLNQVIANPNRYKEGTVMQVTGLALSYDGSTHIEDDLLLGPKVQGFHVDVRYDPGDEGGELSTYLIKRFSVGEKNFPITIRGTLRWVRETQVSIEHASLVADAK